MGADTEWKVDVLRLQPETITVYAVTREEAEKRARNEQGVGYVTAVRHWSEVEDADSASVQQEGT